MRLVVPQVGPWVMHTMRLRIGDLCDEQIRRCHARARLRRVPRPFAETPVLPLNPVHQMMHSRLYAVAESP